MRRLNGVAGSVSWAASASHSATVIGPVVVTEVVTAVGAWPAGADEDGVGVSAAGVPPGAVAVEALRGLPAGRLAAGGAGADMMCGDTRWALGGHQGSTSRSNVERGSVSL